MGKQQEPIREEQDEYFDLETKKFHESFSRKELSLSPAQFLNVPIGIKWANREIELAKRLLTEFRKGSS